MEWSARWWTADFLGNQHPAVAAASGDWPAEIRWWMCVANAWLTTSKSASGCSVLRRKVHAQHAHSSARLRLHSLRCAQAQRHSSMRQPPCCASEALARAQVVQAPLLRAAAAPCCFAGGCPAR